MGRLFDGPGIWIILVVVILLFGATRLPALARSIGQSTKIFRDEIKTDKLDDQTPAGPTMNSEATPTASSPAAPTTAGPTTADPGTSGTDPKK